ncbi:hypothetical protein [Pelagibius sp.]|uniref:hypothetical protein n=1 Tax=Pelagibius sp. TaxID=1931238 RepID=UPI003B50909D
MQKTTPRCFGTAALRRSISATPTSRRGQPFTPTGACRCCTNSPLKPGRVTVARISQAQSELKMVVGRGEILRRPMSFTGTSGVIRFDCGAEVARRALIDAQLEHHVSITYGDVKSGVEAAAAAADLPLLDLDAL